jgi:thiol-disulfide isomerase/thioredoxin
MRLLSILSVALGLAPTLLPAAESTPPVAQLTAGAVAPEFVTQDLAGRAVRIADYRGKVLILDFWATWCSPCIASMPHTQEVAAKYAAQGVEVLAVCTGDKRQRFEDWVRLKAGAYPAIRFTFDPHEQGTPAEAQRASFVLYGVPSIPAQFILNREGRIVATTNGYAQGDTRLEAALAKAGIKIEDSLIAKAEQTEAKLTANRTASAEATPTRRAPPPFTEDAVKLKAGAPIADLAARGADGAALKLSQFRGKPLVLSFSPAEVIPSDFLDRTHARFGADGVQVLALVTRDTEAGYRAWLELHRGKHTFATAFDPSGPDAIRESAIFLAVGMVTPMPLVLVLDAEGRLVGKVAPKVETSFLGLAELLRRTGVKVKADELPSADQMALANAFATATAPSTTPAATTGKTVLVAPNEPRPVASSSGQTAADRDFAAFDVLSKTKPPGKASEMGGMKPYLNWVDAHNQRVTAAGLAFYRSYPNDARRWEVISTMLNLPPRFITGFKVAEPKGPADIDVDEKAVVAWDEQGYALRRAMIAAPDSTDALREPASFALFALESRQLRARLKSGEDKDGRASWERLLKAFDAHLARYAGNPRLAMEAENFLRAWKEAVPGSYEEGWEHLKQSPDAATREAATEKLQSAQRMAKPLELAFTAVDGRPVDLKSLRGKVVLIDFWATWCGPCIAELPNVKQVYAAYHDKGFEVVGISLENARLLPSDSAEQTATKLAAARQVLTDFTTKEKMPWPQHFDGKYWKNQYAVQFGIGAIPAMFLLDQEGRVVSTNARGPQLEKEVKRLLKL